MHLLDSPAPEEGSASPCCACTACCAAAAAAADYFHDAYNKRPENGGQRVVTVLMYLATPEEGVRGLLLDDCMPDRLPVALVTLMAGLQRCAALSRICQVLWQLQHQAVCA